MKIIDDERVSHGRPRARLVVDSTSAYLLTWVYLGDELES